MNTKTPLRVLAEREALDTVFSDAEGLDYDTVVSDLTDPDEGRGEALVWEPFSGWNDEDLADLLEAFAGQFERFARAAAQLSEQ